MTAIVHNLADTRAKRYAHAQLALTIATQVGLPENDLGPLRLLAFRYAPVRRPYVPTPVPLLDRGWDATDERY